MQKYTHTCTYMYIFTPTHTHAHAHILMPKVFNIKHFALTVEHRVLHSNITKDLLS